MYEQSRIQLRGVFYLVFIYDLYHFLILTLFVERRRRCKKNSYTRFPPISHHPHIIKIVIASPSSHLSLYSAPFLPSPLPQPKQHKPSPASANPHPSPYTSSPASRPDRKHTPGPSSCVSSHDSHSHRRHTGRASWLFLRGRCRHG